MARYKALNEDIQGDNVMINNTLINMKEKVKFLNKFFRAPKAIGSVTPSSKFLAQKMVEAVPWSEVESLAELGSGTGAITKYIQKEKNQRSKIILFEQDQNLREQLLQQYPQFSCYPDACQLQAALKHEGIGEVDCVMSGLPFFNFPQHLRDKLLEQILLSLKPGGTLIAFQYSLQLKKQLSLHFDIEKIELVPFNIPPAFIYVCRKKGEN